MADFLFAFGEHPEGRLAGLLRSALAGTVECRELVVAGGVLVVGTAPHDGEVVAQEDGDTGVLLGGPSTETASRPR